MVGIVIAGAFAVLAGLSVWQRRRVRRRILTATQVPGAAGAESPRTAANIARATIDATNARGHL